MDLLISYSRDDSQFVTEFYKTLIADDYDVWVDWQKIPLTADWWQSIREGIDSAQAIAFIISPPSLSSPVCMMELDYAIRSNKRIIPVVLHQSHIKDNLVQLLKRADDDLMREMLEANSIEVIAKNNWMTLAKLNWIFVRDSFSDMYGQFKDAVESDLDYLRLHTRLLERAREWQQKADASYLLDGTEILEALTWLSSIPPKDVSPSELHRDYIDASQTHEQQRQRRVRAGASIAIGVVLILAVVAGLFWQSWQTSRRQQAGINIATSANTAFDEGRTDDGMFYLQQGMQSGLPLPETWYQTLSRAYEPATRYAIDIIEGGIVSNVQLTSEGDGWFGTSDGRIYHYSIATGTHIETLTEHGGFIIDLVLSNDETSLVSIERNGRAIHWDAITGTMKSNVTIDASLTSIAINPITNIIYIGTYNGRIFTWNSETDTINEIDDIAQSSPIRQMVVNHNGTNILTGDDEGQLLIWSLQDNTLTGRLVGHSARIYDIQLSPNGLQAISASNDDTAIVWDLRRQERVHRLVGHDAPVHSVDFDDNGLYFLTAGADNQIILWNTSGEIVQRMIGHTDTVRDVAFFPGSSRLAVSGSEDGTVRYWNLLNSAEIDRYLLHPNHVRGVRFVEDVGIVSVGFDANVHYRSMLDAQPQINYYVDYRLYDVELLPGERAAIVPFRETLIILNLDTMDEIKRIKHHDDFIVDTAVSPDGRYIATASLDSLAQVIDVNNGNLVATLLALDEPVISIAYSPNGAYIATGYSNGTLILWETESFSSIARFEGHRDIVRALEFSPDSQWLASASTDTMIHIWSVENRTLEHTFSGQTEAVLALAFHPSGNYLASGSGETNIAIWDMINFKLHYDFEAHSQAIWALDFNNDGTQLASGSADGSVRIWQFHETESAIWEWILENRFIPNNIFEQ